MPAHFYLIKQEKVEVPGFWVCQLQHQYPSGNLKLMILPYKTQHVQSIDLQNKKIRNKQILCNRRKDTS